MNSNNEAAQKHYELKQAIFVIQSDYILIDDFPCKVIEITKAKSSKQTISEIAFTTIDVYSGQKIVYVSSSYDPMLIPVVKKIDLQVADISQDNFVTFVLPDATLKEDLKLPKDKKEAKKLREIFEFNKDKLPVYFTIIKACGEERIIGARVQSSQ